MLPYSILIADDDEKLLNVLRSYFEQNQCLVYTAETGRQALDMLRRYEPQLLILDLMMPDMDGFEVCRRVRHGYHTARQQYAGRHGATSSPTFRTVYSTVKTGRIKG